jgi:SAM-dependent methyltransferase
LREHVSHVVGVDVDPNSIALARSASDDIEYLQGDFLAQSFAPVSFDLIASVASLHHMDLNAALARKRDLLRPGGVLVVVGVARSSVADSPYDAVGFFAHRFLKLRHGYWQHPSPIADPTHTCRQLRKIFSVALPGAQFRTARPLSLLGDLAEVVDEPLTVCGCEPVTAGAGFEDLPRPPTTSPTPPAFAGTLPIAGCARRQRGRVGCGEALERFADGFHRGDYLALFVRF